MIDYVNLIYVGPQQALPGTIALILWVALAALGHLVTPRGRIVEANPFIGWAFVATLLTLGGVVVERPFWWLTLLCLAGAIVGGVLAFVRRDPLFVPGSWRILVLALPLLGIAGAMAPSQWDEFSHWLPAARFLVREDGFPTADRVFGGYVAYPYGWPILMYLGGRASGGFIDNLGGQLNLVMLLSFAGFALRSAFAVAGHPRGPHITWGLAAATALTATVFNPTFVQKIVLTAYSDVSSSVVTGVAILLGYHLLERATTRQESAATTAWQFGLVLALLVNTRQTNVLIAIVIVCALALITWRDRQLDGVRFILFCAMGTVPAIAVYLAWRAYVAVQFSKSGVTEAGFMPLDRWDFAIIPAMAASIGEIWIKKFAFFAPMIIACVLAVRSVVNCRSALDRIAILTATVFATNTAFLVVAYIGHHGGRYGAEAISYWRYNVDIGMVAVIFMTCALLCWWSRRPSFGRYPSWAAPAALCIVLILPFALAHKLRFDLEPPKPHFTRVAKDMIALGISSDFHLADPRGTGEAAVMTRYYLDQAGVPWLSAFQEQDPAAIATFVRGVPPGEYLLVHSVAPGLAEAIGQTLDPRRSYLLRNEPGGWSTIKDWGKPANHPW